MYRKTKEAIEEIKTTFTALKEVSKVALSIYLDNFVSAVLREFSEALGF